MYITIMCMRKHITATMTAVHHPPSCLGHMTKMPYFFFLMPFFHWIKIQSQRGQKPKTLRKICLFFICINVDVASAIFYTSVQYQHFNGQQSPLFNYWNCHQALKPMLFNRHVISIVCTEGTGD